MPVLVLAFKRRKTFLGHKTDKRPNLYLPKGLCTFQREEKVLRIFLNECSKIKEERKVSSIISNKIKFIFNFYLSPKD